MPWVRKPPNLFYASIEIFQAGRGFLHHIAYKVSQGGKPLILLDALTRKGKDHCINQADQISIWGRVSL